MTRYRFLSLKIHADITTNAFCRLHNDKYTKYLLPENFRYRASSHSFKTHQIYDRFRLQTQNFTLYRCYSEFTAAIFSYERSKPG